MREPAKQAVIAWAIVTSVGCAGALEDPERFQRSRDGGLGENDASLGDASIDDGGRTDVEAEARALIAARCELCHSAALSLGGLDLTGDDVGERLRAGAATCTEVAGQPFVNPNDVANSYFLLKLGPTPPCGARMPQGGALSTDEIELLTRWVESL